MVIASLFIAYQAIRGRIRWYPVAWLTLVILAFANLPPWAAEPMRRTLPNWFWQIVLLTTGIALAVGPLVTYRPQRAARSRSRYRWCDDGWFEVGGREG